MKNNYSRREFLKTVVVAAGTAGSATSLVGCGGDSDDSEDIVTPNSTDINGSVFPQSVASGDPRSSSVVLWTRVNSSETTVSVVVQVANDDNFNEVIAQTRLTASSDFDHCVKAKITNLQPGTRYYYRFIVDGIESNHGRTKTAPLSVDTSNVKFGFVSCQDYTNGYYNTLMKFLESDHDDIDFIVHLGDYIYETTGDPSFQGNVRTVSFSDTSGAIAHTNSDGEVTHYSAKSLSNYRDLYKTYRGDEALQKVHEKFPFIVIWDDHEFSDDSWQATATYFNGTQDETDTTRRKNSEQAFFEYMPIDIDLKTGAPAEEGQVDVDTDNLFGGTYSIYRSFRYGKLLNLMMTDYRSFRPDHLIPEDEFPAKLAMDVKAVGQALYLNPTSTTYKDLVDSMATISNIMNPSDEDVEALAAGIATLVGYGVLPLNTYTDIDSNTELNTFLAAFNATLSLLGSTPFSASDQPTVKELLIATLTQAYSDPSLGQVSYPLSQEDAFAKAQEVVTGNLDVVVLNAYLNASYNSLMATLNATFAASPSSVPFMTAAFTDLDTMFATLAAALGQSGLTAQRELSDGTYHGVSFALMGKTSLNGSFGSRYLVVKSTFDLYNLYRALVLGITEGPYGDLQQTQIFTNLNASTAMWNVLGSSVSYTSLILDANEGSILDLALNSMNVDEETFPRTAYYMNVDHMDGFPLVRATYMNNSSGALPLGTFQDTNTVIISGDIHATFITDHGTSTTSGGSCAEFTTAAVSSGTFGTFTATSIAGILSPDNPTDATALATGQQFAQSLGNFLQLGAPQNTSAPQTIQYANPLVHGVGIIELTTSKLTGTIYQLDTTSHPELLTSPLYGTGVAADNWITATGVITRNSTTGNNSSIEVTTSEEA